MASIRRHVHIMAPPRTVWRALTTNDGLAKWLVDEARFEGRAGGRVVLTTEDDEGNPIEERGIVHKWRPTSHLEISFDTIGQSPNRGSRWSFQVARDGGETRLSVVHSGGEVVSDEALRERWDNEWKEAFQVLQTWLDED